MNPLKNMSQRGRFAKAPPGYSLTQPRGKYAWEKPPKHASAPEAVDAIISNLEKPDIQLHHVQLMASGVSIEEIVNTTTKLGFMEGMFTVDVAEVIKTPLAFYLMGLASDAGIDAKVTNSRDGKPRTNYGMSDAQILNIMRARNPSGAKFITEEMPRMAEEKRQRDVQIQEESFLGEAVRVEEE